MRDARFPKLSRREIDYLRTLMIDDRNTKCLLYRKLERASAAHIVKGCRQ